jgi:endonuclease YncB( thermonuclease family)
MNNFFIRLIFFFYFLNTSIALASGILTGKVVGVSDGDTITLLEDNNTQHKVRLAGIDAPEKRQTFGNASKKSLSDLAYGKRVSVEWKKRDRYERIVGKVLVDGQDINLVQIKRGMAWFYKKYQNELFLDDRLAYLHAQQEAESKQAGLFQDQNPTPPWGFRKIKQSNK